MRSVFCLLFLCGSLLAKPIVLVSVAPQKFLIESIAKEGCIVEVLVPSGASPHTYEPRIRQIDLIKEAALWFRIGESFEERLLPLVKRVVDQRENLDLIGCCCHEGSDPHIWLSPRLLKQQARQICKELESLLGQDLQANLTTLLEKLDQIELQLKSRSFPKAVLVSHPAFGYFCRDFKVEQLSIEKEGQEPSPRELAQLVDSICQRKIGKVFLQEQYSKKAALQIAKQLNLEVVALDPYAEDVLTNLELIGRLFSDSG